MHLILLCTVVSSENHMADHQPIEGSSTSNVSGGSPESTVELNIKTLDSQIYSFHADKDVCRVCALYMSLSRLVLYIFG